MMMKKAKKKMIHDLVSKSRSIRRFYQSVAVPLTTLQELVDVARLSPSGANIQPLKYILANTPEKNGKIFPFLKWAGYLRNWEGPVEGERPAAYIIVLGDTAIRKDFGVDHGIAAQSIMLAACEAGLGGCMLGAILKDGLRQALNIPEQYEILLVLALGAPKETVVIEPVKADGNIEYYRDAQDVHHVPKRNLDALILSI